MAGQDGNQMTFDLPATVRRPDAERPKRHHGRRVPASFTVPPRPTVRALRKAGADANPIWHADEATGRLVPIEHKEAQDLLRRIDEVEVIRLRGLATAEAALKKCRDERRGTR